MSSRRFPRVLLLALLFANCAGHHRNRKTAAVASGPRLVGTVAFVDSQLGFVLVDVGSLYTPVEGSALKSFAGEKETAVLSVSPERKRPFITADIVKGTPQRGDQVFE